MLATTNARHLIGSRDTTTQNFCEGVLRQINTEMTVLKMPIFEDLFPQEENGGVLTSLTHIPPFSINLEWPAVIYHTSGTGLTPYIVYIRPHHF